MGGLGEYPVYHYQVSFCVFFSFFFGLFVTRTGRTGGPILIIYTPYTVFPPKDVPFGGFVDMSPNLGVKSPKTPILGVVNRRFQA